MDFPVKKSKTSPSVPTMGALHGDSKLSKHYSNWIKS